MFQRVRVRARRTLVALVATSLALAAVGTVDEALTTPASAAVTTYNVNSTTDATGSGLCATPTAQCTLRGCGRRRELDHGRHDQRASRHLQPVARCAHAQQADDDRGCRETTGTERDDDRR